MEASYKMTFPASRSCLWYVLRINVDSHAGIIITVGTTLLQTKK